MEGEYTVFESGCGGQAGISPRTDGFNPRYRPATARTTNPPGAQIRAVTHAEKEFVLTASNKNEQQAGDRSWPNVTVYTTSWCPDCRASKRFLASNGIPFTELDIEQNPESAEVVVKLNNGMRRVPTIVIEDGPVLVEPSDRELGRALGVG
jgi:mycoredoxin